jgi:cobalamin synthase
MKLLKGLGLALNMLSIIPFFKVHNFYKGINGYSAMFYPLIGFFLGFILYFTSLLLDTHTEKIHQGVIIFALWVSITGALHLDGLSDTIDGFFVNKSKILDVMKDSHVGGMGMIFTFVFLIFKLSSLIYADAYYLLPIVLMLSRLNATMAIYLYNYISSGVGKLIKDELTLKMVLFAIFYTLLTSYIFSSFLLSIFNIFIFIVISKLLTKRTAGLNGDMYGFIIELSELFLLNYIVFFI